MRSFTIKELINLSNQFEFSINDIKIFVETGTYLGLTAIPMSYVFDSVYTIEISEPSYKYCLKLAKSINRNNINFILGDSSIKLIDLIRKLNKKKYTNVFFFLDGHCTEKDKFTSKGELDVPLLKELDLIYNDFRGSGIILIDDTRLLGKEKSAETGNGDWTDITENAIFENFKDDRIMRWEYTDDKSKDRIIIFFDKK